MKQIDETNDYFLFGGCFFASTIVRASQVDDIQEKRDLVTTETFEVF
jgi:hypothetical protein